MKIVEMRVTPVVMADPPRLLYRLHAPYALRTVIELVSEDGLVGIAETHGGEQIHEDFEHARGTVIGRSAYDLGRLSIDLEALFSQPIATRDGGLASTQTFILPGESGEDISMRVFGAVEVAALDLIGKATGVPVCELLGGRVREGGAVQRLSVLQAPGRRGSGRRRAGRRRARRWILTPSSGKRAR